MPAFNFQKRFAGKVKRNTKPGTIRAKRKKPMKPGDMMHCFTGMRTKKCKRIVSRKCLAIVDVKIIPFSIAGEVLKYTYETYLNGILLEYTSSFRNSLEDQFAKDDGFKSSRDFYAFFSDNYGIPFHGDWYVWNKSALEKYLPSWFDAAPLSTRN